MIGEKHAVAAARRYSSGSGMSPENPAKSQPHANTPETPADNPAMIDDRKASHVERSSPAQWAGVDPAPVYPALLKVNPSTSVSLRSR